MTEEKVPYGSSCGPSYQDLQKKVQELETINEQLAEQVQDGYNLSTEMMEYIDERVTKDAERTSTLENHLRDICGSLGKMVNLNTELLSKISRRTKYAIAACALTAIIAGSAGYYIGKSQLEEKVSNAASIQQQSERR